MRGIPARRRKCISCESRFEQGARVVTHLTEGAEGYLRADYCGTCGDLEASGLEGLWEGVVPVVQEKGAPPDFEEQLLRKLEELVEAKLHGKAQLLAIYMERQGLLLRYVAKGGARTALFEVIASGESFEIPMAHASSDEIEELVESLGT